MYISEFKVGNYKSYRETPAVQLPPGFNIIVGQNNAGKTALLEALGLAFGPNPHRSLKTVPSPGLPPHAVSWVDVAFSVGREELLEMMLASGTPQWYIAQPAPHDPLAGESPQNFVRNMLSQKDYTFRLRLQKGGPGPDWRCPKAPSFGIYDAMAPAQRVFFVFEVKPDKSTAYIGSQARQDETDLGLQLAPIFQSHVYRFHAERFNVGECAFGQNSNLAQNAANLPEVLNILQGNPSKFRELNALVSAILPHVRLVSVKPANNQRLQIIVWGVDPETKRDDLAVPLNESGNGVGQVLAMLYVALTSKRPQTILIDEPQSFLHPGAVRKLMEVLSGYEHQFVVATHSPTVVASAKPSTLSLLKLQGSETIVGPVNPTEAKDLYICLAEVGARLADVFGADRILWVEGVTEEICFPLILRKIGKQRLMGTTIVGIRSTGELEGREAQKVFAIYRRLSKGSSLLPPAVGFILDKECRSLAEQQDLRRNAVAPVSFLPRRMYENYLLRPATISALASSIDGFRQKPVTEEEVQNAIAAKQGHAKYFCPGEPPRGAGEWVANVDGARILKEVFAELSETRVVYDKVKHSVALTEWLIENAPEDLKEIADLLCAMLGG